MYKAIILAALFGVALAHTPPNLRCATIGTGPASSCEQFICDFCSGVSKAPPVGNGESGGACYNLASVNQNCLFSAFNSGNVTGWYWENGLGPKSLHIFSQASYRTLLNGWNLIHSYFDALTFLDFDLTGCAYASVFSSEFRSVDVMQYGCIITFTSRSITLYGS
ncbi:hypothetical protein NP233_g863 [Leucocoprinus birnbaumii]|uniref:Glycan binding protein Y3-like domain-containing protein n=1 Tax=Leucocoprinus birnbaumii TaxID=56174 RepID=A0AAD5W142_9AGAR|nr:hypothetical protein NP233_g863 [Leucocoprinus birnbaumii]